LIYWDSDYAHVDQQEGIDYINGVRTNLSYPLSCITSYIDTDISAIKSAYGEIIQKCLIWEWNWKLINHDDVFDNFT